MDGLFGVVEKCCAVLEDMIAQGTSSSFSVSVINILQCIISQIRSETTTSMFSICSATLSWRFVIVFVLISAKLRTQPSSASTSYACSRSCSTDPSPTTKAIPDPKSCSPVRRSCLSTQYVYFPLPQAPYLLSGFSFM